MPCPYFEPRQALPQPTYPSARLPLIDEYDGVCHARTEALPVEAEGRLRFCFRFDVVQRSVAGLELLFIEEAFFAPLAWRRLQFVIDGERLEPDPADPCERAQILAFCRSYLRRHRL
jgi:hypothetical protein